MNKHGIMMFLYAETPLHVGSGVGLGAVDLPLQRERMSGLPMIQGSGIKGAWRERMEPTTGQLASATWEALFGPKRSGKSDSNSDESAQDADADNNKGSDPTPDEFAGAIALTDARLLLFPARTVWGGWAWVTAPMVLERLARDIAALGLETPEALMPWTGDASSADNDGRVQVTASSRVAKQDRFIVEDLDYKAEHSQHVDDLASWLQANVFPAAAGYEAFVQRLPSQLVVMSDTEFKFLSAHATEVVARTSIDAKTGTVATGQLWTEENLPAESVLWAVGSFDRSRHKNDRSSASDMRQAFVDAAADIPRIQLGGNRSVGRGLVGVRVWSEPAQGGNS